VVDITWLKSDATVGMEEFTLKESKKRKRSGKTRSIPRKAGSNPSSRPSQPRKKKRSSKNYLANPNSFRVFMAMVPQQVLSCFQLSIGHFHPLVFLVSAILVHDIRAIRFKKNREMPPWPGRT